MPKRRDRRLPTSGVLALALFAGVGRAHADPITDATDRVTARELVPVPAESAPTAPVRPKLQVEFAGGVSLSAAFVDWHRPTASGARDGDLRFSVLRIGTRARYDALRLDVDWRIYPNYMFLRHAVLAYELTTSLSIDVGVSRAPFGLLPFASNSWFFGLPYYVGLEDDGDFGLRLHWAPRGWDLWLSFYKNSEGHYFGRSLDSARFSYDVVQASATELAGSGISAARSDRETNTGVARAAYTLERGKFALELGASGRVGMLQDLVSDARSLSWATAAHARFSYGGLALDLEGIAYRYRPHVAAGDDARLVAMGAFDAPYAVASRGQLLVANLGYGFDVAWGPIELVRVYADTGQLWKQPRAFRTSRQLVLGTYLLAGPIHFSVDAALGQHHPWVGPDYGVSLGAGRPDAGWHRWINLNIGFAY